MEGALNNEVINKSTELLSAETPIAKRHVDPLTPADGAKSSKKYFDSLFEQGRHAFAALRELSPISPISQYQHYFQRTFTIFTELWDNQLKHRKELEEQGLKRWEIGEIASKIGQLYYHYYLKTGETNFLQESFTFYSAIADREYFKHIEEAKGGAGLILKLRFMARFVVVSLLLGKKDESQKLTQELALLINDHSNLLDGKDASEWAAVTAEIEQFLNSEKSVLPVDVHGKYVENQARLLKNHTARPFEGPTVRLQEVVLISNFPKQIKFSELTIDLYRVLVSLEREPVLKQDEEGDQKKGPIKRQNPLKYILCNPSYSTVMTFLAHCFKELQNNSAMMIYISAEGSASYKQESEEAIEGGELLQMALKGGVITRARQTETETIASEISTHCLYPMDLFPFSRKPLFLVVDSTNSVAYTNIPSIFNQPIVCLLSPVAYPAGVKDFSQFGSLFTLFLHQPLVGFAVLNNISEDIHGRWGQATEMFNSLENVILQELRNCPEVNDHLKLFVTDAFMCRYICRFVICKILLQHHKEYKYLPTSYPSFPTMILDSEVIQNALLGIFKLFSNSDIDYDFETPQQ